ncbi:MAG: rhomboid family intramembrane serine protease [Kofleriaceae bacterium]
MKQRRFQFSNLGITRGALVVLGLTLGMSLLWLLSKQEARIALGAWTLATPSNVFENGRVWTLLTSPLIETKFISLLFLGLVMWMFVPTLERFWGTARFYRFVVVTSVVGTTCGTLVGWALGSNVLIAGLSPFLYASFVAFGMVYAKQPVQFFGVLPLTGRQLMYGILAFVTLYVVLQQAWAEGASFAGAMVAAALMVSKFSPGLLWKKWRIRRARAKLTVMQGGQGGASSKKRPDDQKYLN